MNLGNKTFPVPQLIPWLQQGNFSNFLPNVIVTTLLASPKITWLPLPEEQKIKLWLGERRNYLELFSPMSQRNHKWDLRDNYKQRYSRRIPLVSGDFRDWFQGYSSLSPGFRELLCIGLVWVKEKGRHIIYHVPMWLVNIVLM